MAYDAFYNPARIIIEYNGMWLVSNFEKMQKPEGWGVEQQITCVDASTFQMYMANMKSIFMDMVRNSDMVVFNRCKKRILLQPTEEGSRWQIRERKLFLRTRKASLTIFSRMRCLFDVNAPVIDILPEDYGIWFVDAMDHPETYVNKTVKFKARVMKPRGMGSKFFVPGRTAMTCCADDTTFLGYVCKSAFAPKLQQGQWVEVTAKVGIENRMEYQGEGIVLYADFVEPCEPLEEEMVYFN